MTAWADRLGPVIIAVLLIAVVLVLVAWVGRLIVKLAKTEITQQTRASAAFRARWPSDQVWRAPYDELEAEILGCWEAVLELEPLATIERGDKAELDRQAADVKRWIATLLGPLNAAAARESPYGVPFSPKYDRYQARLMTYSSAFWARWPANRLPAAPYAELADEASRCEQLIVYTRSAMRPARYGSPPPTTPGDYLHQRLSAYRGMLAAVQHAMARSAGYP